MKYVARGESSGGYLGDFGSHPEFLRFYVDCGLDVIPTDFRRLAAWRITGHAVPAAPGKEATGADRRRPLGLSCRHGAYAALTNARSLVNFSRTCPIGVPEKSSNLSNSAG